MAYYCGKVYRPYVRCYVTDICDGIDPHTGKRCGHKFTVPREYKGQMVCNCCASVREREAY